MTNPRPDILDIGLAMGIAFFVLAGAFVCLTAEHNREARKRRRKIAGAGRGRKPRPVGSGISAPSPAASHVRTVFIAPPSGTVDIGDQIAAAIEAHDDDLVKKIAER